MPFLMYVAAPAMRLSLSACDQVANQPIPDPKRAYLCGGAWAQGFFKGAGLRVRDGRASSGSAQAGEVRG
jgi:hypothetical protein